MRLDISGYRIAIAGADPSLTARLRERYGPFLEPASADPAADPAPPAFTLGVRVDPARRVPGQHPEHVDNPAVAAEGTLDRVTLRGEGFEGELDWRAGAGQAVVPDSLTHVDLFVRVALGVGLLREGGTLLHAAGVVRDRFGIAFSGPSGAGKSTAARLSQGAGLDVLADEMLVFRRAGFGARFHGTPFWNGAPASAPCGAILFLEQAGEHRVASLPPARALPRLLAAGGAPLDLPAVQEAFFAACGELLRRVPAYVLRFAKDAGFWDVLDRLPEFAYFRPAAPRAPAAAGPRPLPLTALPPRTGP